MLLSFYGVCIKNLNMKTHLEHEIYDILQELKIVLFPNHPLARKIDEYCAGFRNYLLGLENTQSKKPLMCNTFWDLTPKYKLDVLSIDIQRIANQIAYAIGFSTLYLKQIRKNKHSYFPTFADAFFWYHIDFGVRLISSGWDRLAFLLDLAHGLNTGTRCSISVVLKEMQKIDAHLVRERNFKILKNIHDTELPLLESGRGKGARHETTHILSPSTRFLFEFIDSNQLKSKDINSKCIAADHTEILNKHYHLYVTGIESAIKLVSLKWPDKKQKGLV